MNSNSTNTNCKNYWRFTCITFVPVTCVPVEANVRKVRKHYIHSYCQYDTQAFLTVLSMQNYLTHRERRTPHKVTRNDDRRCDAVTSAQTALWCRDVLRIRQGSETRRQPRSAAGENECFTYWRENWGAQIETVFNVCCWCKLQWKKSPAGMLTGYCIFRLHRG